MNEFVSMNYFMVRFKHSSYFVLLWFLSITHLFSFRLSAYPMLAFVDGLAPFFVDVSLDTLTAAHQIVDSLSFQSCEATHRFLFSLQPQMSLFSGSEHCPGHTVGDSDWHSLRQFHIVKLFVNSLIWLLLFFCLHPI